MRIAVDIDEILCEFVGEFLKWYNDRHGTKWVLTDFADYHWPNFLKISVEETIAEVHRFFETEQFRALPLVEGARQGVAKLAKEHELYIVTGRQNVTKDVTCQWLDRNFPGVFKAVEFTNNYPQDGGSTLAKGEVCRRLGCEVLIDDDTRHVGSLMECGVKLIVLRKPWNEGHQLPDSVICAEDWRGVVEAVNQLVKV